MNKPINTLAALSMLAGALVGLPGTAAAEEKTMPRAGMMQDAKEGCPGYGMMGGGMGSGAGMGMMGGMGPGMGMMDDMGPGMGGGMGGFGPGMMGMGPMAMLDLSDAQTAQLQKVQAEFMKAQRPLMRRIWRNPTRRRSARPTASSRICSARRSKPTSPRKTRWPPC